MVLAGLKPDVICDVAGRALAFWMYQMSEDRAYLAAAVARGRRRFDELERYYEKNVRQLQVRQLCRTCCRQLSKR